jgi:uncharacterized protein YlxW (UPF0749 family)
MGVQMSDLDSLLDRKTRRVRELEAEVERLREELADTETEKIERGTEILRLREAAEEVVAQDLSGETVLVSLAAYRKLDAVLAGQGNP